MPGFKKGNKYSFKSGNIPRNKTRTKDSTVKSDLETPKYIRLTRKTHELVVNDPYTDPEQKIQQSSHAVKLLRPKKNLIQSPRSQGKELKKANSKTFIVYQH